MGDDSIIVTKGKIINHLGNSHIALQKKNIGYLMNFKRVLPRTCHPTASQGAAPAQLDLASSTRA